jgi:MSHA biogenesis protein MshM
MYLQHFGLSELPFGITPDTAFAFSARSHQEALNTLLVALDSGEGFIKITGEVGTGKTLLCRKLLATLGPKYKCAYVLNPAIRPRTLLLAVGEELGVSLDAKADEHAIVKALNAALLGFAAEGRSVVLLIDEAQALPLASLESLRLLSNLETEKRKLLQIVFFGQPELDTKLADPAVRQLRQRIVFQYCLSGLGHSELERYVAHRLRVAGHRGRALFSRHALRQLHRSSRGVPRLVNILAHKALLVTFGEGGNQVGARQVRAAGSDSPQARPAGPFGWWWASAGIAILAVAAFAGMQT